MDRQVIKSLEIQFLTIQITVMRVGVVNVLMDVDVKITMSVRWVVISGVQLRSDLAVFVFWDEST